MELVRALRDSRSWETASGGNGFLNSIKGCTNIATSKCSMNKKNLSVIANSTLEGELTRAFIATKLDGGAITLGTGISEVRVSVQVSWKVGTATKYARLYSDFTNWKN